MGFLEDIGRSGAMNSVNNVMERAIQLRQQEDQGAERAFNASLNMEKLGMEKAAADREATKFRWAEKEQKAKEDILDMPVPISKFLGTDYTADPAKKMMFDMAKQKGMVNEVAPGVLMTTTRNAQAFKQYMNDDLEFTKKLNETNMVKINNQIAELGTALLEESNPKKIEEMTATKAKLEQQLGVLAKAHKDIDFAHQNKLEEIAAAREGKAAEVVGLDPATKQPVTKSATSPTSLAMGGQPYTPKEPLLPVTQSAAGETKTAHLDKKDPQGKTWPGGTLWERGPNGRYDVYVGPAPKSATLQGAQILNEPLTEKEQRTVDSFVQGIADGKIAPSQMNSFLTSRGTGSVAKMKIAIGTAAIDRGINLPEAEANYKAKSSTFAINRVQLAKTVLPMADKLITTIDKIPEGIGFVPADEFARKMSKYMNANDIAQFEFQKNKLVEEFERMLTGSQMADSRVQRNLDLIRSGYDKKTLKWMANEVKSISNISINAATSDMYPDAGGAGKDKPPSVGKNSVLRNGKWVVE